VLRSLLLVSLGLLMCPAAGEAQKTPAAAATMVTTSAGPMFTVSRLLVEDTWNPLLARRIQESPAARPLGAAWKPSDTRWQQARAALGARMTHILDAYAGSNELTKHIETEVGRIGQSHDLDTVLTAIKAPLGPAIIRQQAKQTYIVHAMSAGGPASREPAIGSPEWITQLNEMGRRFDDRAGTNVPADDGAHKAELEKFYANRPLAEVLRRIWDFGIDNATRQLNTALNLMVFDNQDAIEKDIAAAIGRVSPGARTSAPPPAAAAFPLEQMATCQDSWLDWKDDPVSSASHRDSLRAQFRQGENDAFFVPIASATVMGLPVSQVYSNTVGMGVGFSVQVTAPFDSAKKAVERSLGKPLKKCETSDGMRTCELEIGVKKTVMLLSDAAGKSGQTLIGCFYYYEK
jgi:hypothetical protein